MSSRIFLSRTLLSLVLLLLFTTLLLAQPPAGGPPREGGGTGTVKGKILDAATGQALAYATIYMRHFRDTTIVTGGITDEKGLFAISEVPYGRYSLRATFMGYETFRTDSVAVRPNAPVFTLPTVALQPDASQLAEVEINEERSTMEMQIDKKVFNVEKSAIAEGGTAVDVLQQIPAVSVDIDNQLTLRGSGNVQVLVNGKPTAMSVSTLIQQLPANQIKSIEIITNPSAKYDPDGMSGIINIVLKQNRQPGYNGNIQFSAGTNDKYNTTFSANARRGKWNVFGSYNLRYNESFGLGGGSFASYFPDTAFFYEQESNSDRLERGHNVRLGLDFMPNARNTVSISGGGNLGSGNRYEENSYFFPPDGAGPLQWAFERNTSSGSQDQSWDALLDYRLTFENPRQSFSASVSTNRSWNESHADYFQDTLYPVTTTEPVLQRDDNEGFNANFTAQADYVHPWREKAQIEGGLKAIIRRNDGSVGSELYSWTDGIWQNNAFVTNHFIFDEQLYSAYANYAEQFGKWGVQVGVRAEQTLTTANQVTLNEVYPNDYFNVFPSAFVKYKMNEKQEFGASYSRRVNRPSMNSLNPFRELSDPLNIRQGNPYLNPEFTDSYELNYQLISGKLVFSASAYWRHITDQITRFKTVDSTGVSYVNFVNLTSANSYGLEWSAKGKLMKWWDALLSFNTFRTKLNGSNIEADLNNDAFNWSAKLLTNMNIPKLFDLQISYNYNSRNVTILGYIRPVHFLDIAIRRDFFNKKLSLTLKAGDIFDTRQFGIVLDTETIQQDFFRKRESRILTLSASWRFGAQDKNPSRQRRNSGGQDQGPGGGAMDMM